jgi:hypothetical protein
MTSGGADDLFVALDGSTSIRCALSEVLEQLPMSKSARSRQVEGEDSNRIRDIAWKVEGKILAVGWAAHCDRIPGIQIDFRFGSSHFWPAERLPIVLKCEDDSAGLKNRPGI